MNIQVAEVHKAQHLLTKSKRKITEMREPNLRNTSYIVITKLEPSIFKVLEGQKVYLIKLCLYDIIYSNI